LLHPDESSNEASVNSNLPFMGLYYRAICRDKKGFPMNILKKRTILKLAATFMLAGMMAGAFAMHTSAAFASATVACDPATSVAGSTTSGTPNCYVAVTVSPNIPVSGLSFTSDASAVGAGAAIGANSFTFGATVTDVRETQEGWQLQAVSAGLSNTNHTAIFIPLTIGTTGSTATCTVTDVPVIAGSTCPNPTITPRTLNNTTPQTFVTETSDGTNPISGVASITAKGTYTIPVGTYPGAYSGAITLSLLNTFA
jgi:hypothetical protein